jgi:hypothetical protein
VPANVPCDDGNPCTTADTCQAGVCGGLRIAGCCRTDDDCKDPFACTADRCAEHQCLYVPLDDRCGPPADCGRPACAPREPGADTLGCVVRAVDEGSYCTEDGDPCTIDACQAGACEHDPDGSGPRCPMLVTPFRTARDLLTRARGLRASVACTGGPNACDITSGEEAARLLALLDSTATSIETSALAIAGRLASSSPADTSRESAARARLALGLLADAPGNLRAFLATLRQARSQHLVGATFARLRRAEATRLLRGTGKLRTQLQRVVMRRRTFAR